MSELSEEARQLVTNAEATASPFSITLDYDYLSAGRFDTHCGDGDGDGDGVNVLPALL